MPTPPAINSIITFTEDCRGRDHIIKNEAGENVIISKGNKYKVDSIDNTSGEPVYTLSYTDEGITHKLTFTRKKYIVDESDGEPKFSPYKRLEEVIVVQAGGRRNNRRSTRKQNRRSRNNRRNRQSRRSSRRN